MVRRGQTKREGTGAVPSRPSVSECPKGTHATLDEALACHRCQAASLATRTPPAAAPLTALPPPASVRLHIASVRLHLADWPSAAYRSHVVAWWPVGETRDVPADLAAYLLTTFPGHFVEV